MTSMRWGIIGCGDVTEVKSGPAFQRVAGSELVAVMRRDAARAEDYARRHGVSRWHSDADDILHADDIDAVYIATHPNTHRDYVERAAAAGKAVLVEKPMALDAAECHAMQAACDDAGVPLWTAYYRRALPRFERVRELLAEGEIGDVRAVNALRFQARREHSWQNRPGLSGGGWFFDAACHALDYLDHLFGPLEQVAGHSISHHPHGLEDTTVASFRFASGIVGSGTWCFDADAEADAMTIVGERGSVTLSVSAPEPIVVIRGAERRVIDIPDPPHVHQPLVETIVAEWNGSGTCPSTGVSGARTAAVMDTLLARVQTV